MVWLIVAASQIATANLCFPPKSLGEVVRLGPTRDRGLDFWVYDVPKAKDPSMLTRVQCFVDERPLTAILDEDDRMLGEGAINLADDRRLPERTGCSDNIGYVERNGSGGFRAVVYGRKETVVAALRVDTGSVGDRSRLISIIEQFRTILLGCPVSPGK